MILYSNNILFIFSDLKLFSHFDLGFRESGTTWYNNRKEKKFCSSALSVLIIYMNYLPVAIDDLSEVEVVAFKL